MVGVVVGLAVSLLKFYYQIQGDSTDVLLSRCLQVYHATALDVPLPTAAFKRLLNKPVTLADLASLRPALARGLQDLLDYDGNVEETFCRNFVGEVRSTRDLIHRLD